MKINKRKSSSKNKWFTFIKFWKRAYKKEKDFKIFIIKKTQTSSKISRTLTPFGSWWKFRFILIFSFFLVHYFMGLVVLFNTIYIMCSIQCVVLSCNLSSYDSYHACDESQKWWQMILFQFLKMTHVACNIFIYWNKIFPFDWNK